MHKHVKAQYDHSVLCQQCFLALHLYCAYYTALYSEIQRDRWAFQHTGQYLRVILSIGKASTKCQHPTDQNLP